DRIRIVFMDFELKKCVFDFSCKTPSGLLKAEVVKELTVRQIPAFQDPLQHVGEGVCDIEIVCDLARDVQLVAPPAGPVQIKAMYVKTIVSYTELCTVSQDIVKCESGVCVSKQEWHVGDAIFVNRTDNGLPVLVFGIVAKVLVSEVDPKIEMLASLKPDLTLDSFVGHIPQVVHDLHGLIAVQAGSDKVFGVAIKCIGAKVQLGPRGEIQPVTGSQVVIETVFRA